MYSIALFALLAGSEYATVQAAQIGRRASDTPVALWGACNYPSQGINGPLPCASGSECICKDDTYAQCREQVDGSWTPAGSSWQCQGPGDTGSGSTGGTASPPPAAGSGVGAAPASSSSTVPSSGGSSGSGSTTPSTGSSDGSTGKVAANEKLSENQVSGASNNDASTAGASTPATVGDCTSVSAPAGFDGVASTSYYGWMGSACDCGQSAWQWSGGAGFYNAAVNQKLFGGTLNDQGQPNCGSACGTCYELSTSGANAYNDGVGSGSTITVQIVDACFHSGDHWCGSTSDDYKDSSNCGVHFDIMTGSPGTDGQAAVGSDGRVWNDGGQIVYYTPVACPGQLAGEYSGCTCG